MYLSLLFFGGSLCFTLFQFVDVTADTEYDADVGTVDQGGCTAFAYQRKRLSRNGHDAYRYQHVEHGLCDKQEADAHDQEGIVRLVATSCDASDTHQQPDVEKSYNASSYQSQFFDDDGIDEIGEGL